MVEWEARARLGRVVAFLPRPSRNRIPVRAVLANRTSYGDIGSREEPEGGSW